MPVSVQQTNTYYVKDSKHAQNGQMSLSGKIAWEKGLDAHFYFPLQISLFYFENN